MLRPLCAYTVCRPTVAAYRNYRAAATSPLTRSAILVRMSAQSSSPSAPAAALAPVRGYVSDVKTTPFGPGETTRFVPRPIKMSYKLHFVGREVQRGWEVLPTMDAVAILIYHRTKKEFLLVRQFRPPVYLSSTDDERKKPGAGFTLELCAGLIDKPGKSLQQIAAEEIHEEVGYIVDPASLEPVVICHGNVGLSGQKIHIYYAEVDESMADPKAGGGLVDENELIEVCAVPEDKALDVLFNGESNLPESIGFGFLWWFQRRGKPSASAL